MATEVDEAPVEQNDKSVAKKIDVAVIDDGAYDVSGGPVPGPTDEVPG